jgi:hypothetical protein
MSGTPANNGLGTTGTGANGVNRALEGNRAAARAGINSGTDIQRVPNSGLTGTATGNAAAPGTGNVNAGGSASASNTGTAAATVGAGASGNNQGNIQAIAVSKITGLQVLDPTGDVVGSVDSVVAHGQKFASLIVGGERYLGIGAKEVSIPIGQAFMRDGKIVLRSMGADQIKLEDAWTGGGPDDRKMSDDETVTIAVQ